MIDNTCAFARPLGFIAKREAKKRPNGDLHHILRLPARLDLSSWKLKRSEQTMRTNSLNRVSLWRQLKQRFAETRRSSRVYHELMGLSDRCLRDIGLSRAGVADLAHSQPYLLHRL